MAEFSSGICNASNITCKHCVYIFAFGHNSFGQIKQNGVQKINTPSLVTETFPGDGQFPDIHSTWSFTLFARENGVSVLGSTEPSEKHQVKTVKVPWIMRKILLSPNQSQLVGLTFDNSLVLSEETSLTSSLEMPESNRYDNIWRTHDGVLAQESVGNYTMLTFQGGISSVKFPLEKGTAVSQVSCGHCHSLILTADHSVYTYGIGTRGELGLGDLEGKKVPVQLEALGGLRVTQLSCGGWHNLALTESGDVYSWGWNESGQLGLETIVQVISTPTLLPLQERREGLEFKKVSCGSRHSCALTREGRVYTWGWGEYGQLGHGDLISRSSPHPLDLSAVMAGGRTADVIAGYWNTFLITTKL